MMNKPRLEKQGVTALPLYSSKWKDVNISRGINPSITQYSPFVEPSIIDDISQKYWRDRPTRVAMEEKINAYFTHDEYSYDKTILIKSMDDVFDKLNILPSSLIPQTFAECWPQLNKSATTGYPMWKKKSDAREEIFRLFSRNKRKLKATWNIPVFPAAMGARACCREKPKNKPRLVWIYPADITLLEAQFALPLMEACVPKEQFGWSFRWNDNGYGLRKYTQLTSNTFGTHLYTTDYSSFDSTIPRELLKMLFGRMKSFYKMDPTLLNQWELISRYFMDTPIHVYDGIVQKKKGIPSGSYFTSIVGSLVNLTLQTYFAYFRNVRESLDVAIALGDDCLTRYINRGGFDAGKHLQEISLIAQSFGMTIHPDKSDWLDLYADPYDKELTFLGMPLLRCYPHIKVNLESVIARVCVPENKDRKPTDVLLRLHGLVYSYGYHYPTYAALLKMRNYLYENYSSDIQGFDFIQDHYDPETFRLFKFVLNRNLDISRWPRHEEILVLYFGYF